MHFLTFLFLSNGRLPTTAVPCLCQTLSGHAHSNRNKTQDTTASENAQVTENH